MFIFKAANIMTFYELDRYKTNNYYRCFTKRILS